MMRMSGRVTSCWVALFLALTSVSAIQKLNSINDLKRIDFGHTVPKHSLLLLHWFANIVDIDHNNVIWLTFNPNNEDYGSHHYGNYDNLLDPLPYGNIRHRYYTVGNLNQAISSAQLPNYVVHPRREYAGRNRDRIIFRVREQNTGWQTLHRIDRVYITQHYEASGIQGTYDPDQTYEITTNLLIQIREFSVGQNSRSLEHLRDRFGSNANDFQLRDIRNTWGNLACLGLLLFIVMQDRYNRNQYSYRPQHEARGNSQLHSFDNFPATRQSHWNTDTSDTCIIVGLILLIVMIFVIFGTVSSGGRIR